MDLQPGSIRGTRLRIGEVARSPVLHRAAWVMTMEGPPLCDGAVLTQSGRVLAVGAFRALRSRCPADTTVRDHTDCALLPGLVNAHTHLELTGLEGQIALPQPGFAPWLEELMPLRRALSAQSQETALEDGQRRLFQEATALCADITNGATLGCRDSTSGTARTPILEVIGFDRPDLESALGLEVRASLDAAVGAGTCGGLGAHACYSTSPSVIREIKEAARTHGLLFSIHVAEHEDEIEFLQAGTGACRELLEKLGKWIPGWEPPGRTPIQYLDDLGVLDERTLLVHCVHLTRQDWQIVGARGCSVCFCPRSNRSLNVGRAEIARAAGRNISWALGTDSLASNRDLSLFAEACAAMESNPQVSPDEFLRAVTRGGARALHVQQDYGSIRPGKRDALIAVSLPASLRKAPLSETILYRGNEGEWTWVHHPRPD